MNRDELTTGFSAGLVAGAATAGTLVAIGRRVGTASRPFNVIAAHVLGPRAGDAFGFVPGITLTGVGVHLVVTCAFTVLILAVVRRRLSPLWLASAGIALLCALVSIGIARRGGQSLAGLFPVGDLALYYLVLAASLVAGIRFALHSSRIEPAVE